MSSTKEKIGLSTLLTVFVAATTILLLQEPIAQESGYHQFRDSRTIFGIENFSNVVSNLLFLIVGSLGLARVIMHNNLILVLELKLAYILLFLGVTLVAFGSSYYHFTPNNETLLWDRLPMTIAFMALFSIVIGEFISIKLAKRLLVPLVLSGVASVVYWYVGESNGIGDLRYYVLVQFIPVLCIPVILLFFQSSFSKNSGYWWLVFSYVVAKLFEYFDGVIFDFLGELSGHSLKHITVALGLLVLLNTFGNRTKTS